MNSELDDNYIYEQYVYLSYKGYTGSVEYSKEDHILFGSIQGIEDSVSYDGDTLFELANYFIEAVNDYIELKKF